MILARILAPEAFGVVATIAMIISFAEMFTDAGFQKYLVQREFKDDIENIKVPMLPSGQILEYLFYF